MMVKVIGLGDNVVDKYVHIRTMYPGGNALNFSVFASMLGAKAAYMGTFGTDEAAAHVRIVLAELGIDTSRCLVVNGENGCAQVTVEQGDRVFLGSNEGGINKEHRRILGPEELDYLKGFDLVHSSAYSYLESELPKLKQAGIPLSFDFSDDFTEDYFLETAPSVTYSFLSGSHLAEADRVRLMKKGIELGNKMIVVTLGSEGAVLFDGSSFYKQKPKLVEAVDTMGAGDSFLTAFLFAYTERIKHGVSHSAEILEASLASAASFAANTCLLEGAFGFGKTYE
jgi:fructoselysine 6-kinase